MKTMTYATAIAQAQAEEMRRDERVFILGEDVGVMGGAFYATRGLYNEFGGKRVIDTPISEAAIVGAAIGAALAGMRPIAEVQYIEFLDYIDPLINHAAKIHFMSGGKIPMPIVVRLPNGGKGGNAAAHSQSLEAWFMHVPGLLVAMPSNPCDAKGLLKTAIRNDNPVVFIEDKLLYMTVGQVEEGEYTLPFGKANVVREGKDVTVIAMGWMVSRALIAASQLEKEGIDIEIIDPRTLNPLDMETIIGSVKKTGKAIIAHQACKTCGVGAEIAARIMEEAFDFLKAPVRRVAGLDAPVAYCIELEKVALPTEMDIIDAVKDML